MNIFDEEDIEINDDNYNNNGIEDLDDYDYQSKLVDITDQEDITELNF
jgi:hypothetical protein